MWEGSLSSGACQLPGVVGTYSVYTGTQFLLDQNRNMSPISAGEMHVALQTCLPNIHCIDEVPWLPQGHAKEIIFTKYPQWTSWLQAEPFSFLLIGELFRILWASVSHNVLLKYRFPGKPKQLFIILRHSLNHRHARPFPNLPQTTLIFLKSYRNPGIFPGTMLNQPMYKTTCFVWRGLSWI